MAKEQKTKDKIKLLKLIRIGVIIIALVIFGSYFLLSWTIGGDVKQYSQHAQNLYQGDRVEALMAVLQSPDRFIFEKDHAIWALGQLGDSRALPLLDSLYTGEECDHERKICQYELKKAIKGCKGSFNATAWIWR